MMTILLIQILEYIYLPFPNVILVSVNPVSNLNAFSPVLSGGSVMDEPTAALPAEHDTFRCDADDPRFEETAFMAMRIIFAL
jgi:hypothetical protein